MKNLLFSLVTLVVLVALAFKWMPRPELRVQGLGPKASAHEAVARFGVPQFVAHTNLEKEWRTPGVFLEWGPAELPGRGKPSLLFSPDGELLVTVGETLELAGVGIGLGAQRVNVVDMLGEPSERDRSGLETYRFAAGRLTLAYDAAGKLECIIREAPGSPNRAPLFYQQTIGLWLNSNKGPIEKWRPELLRRLQLNGSAAN